MNIVTARPMRSWMITLLVSLLFNISNAISCDFNKEIKSVYSLSGSVTLALRDLGLLKNKKLLGISSFHPVPQKDFNGKLVFGEVTNYFENRTTNGVVEGINNKLKLIKRSGYGFRNFDNFKLRSLICWHLDIGRA